ncbi:hypothetical protein IE53DRAFT_285877 [Violaceomyces palustris]|uniref:Uncharacterized protein n=1 Tax=Violaceomyces palustris TaxID=1673888 RepID=A0ACD0P306_9BASI|nr:hypothetical protein IE53DRAFT_285877 [Violaceomyces palustris]
MMNNKDSQVPAPRRPSNHECTGFLLGFLPWPWLRDPSKFARIVVPHQSFPPPRAPDGVASRAKHSGFDLRTHTHTHTHTHASTYKEQEEGGENFLRPFPLSGFLSDNPPPLIFLLPFFSSSPPSPKRVMLAG